MTGALVILAAMIIIGAVLYLTDVFYYRRKHPSGQSPAMSDQTGQPDLKSKSVNPTDQPEVCCGTHIVCEKTNLSPVTGEIVYYDDEELDRFRGRDAEDYTEDEIEEFRDVLMTLLPQDVAGWSRSIQVRGITLPTEIREELLMIVSDLRQTQ